VRESPSRVFIARLARVAVFDPNGDQVGQMRDVVVSVREEPHPPRVLGIVIEVPMRRRVFLPITRVISLDARQVITTGVINMQRFDKRPGETLVLAEMLDRSVRTKAKPDEPATVVDVAMEQTRAKDWDVTQLYVRRGGGPFRRRGHAMVVDWADVTGLEFETAEQGVATLLAAFEKLRPADLASELHDLSPARRAQVVAALQDDKLADVLEELPDDDQIEILGQLAAERAADVLEAMDPDDAADLLGGLTPDRQEALLHLMEPEDAEDVRRLLSYDEYTAGGMMTTEPIICSPDATIAEALARVRNPDLSPALAAQVYVCRSPQDTPTGRFLGIAHIQRLLREPPSSLVSAIADNDLEPVGPEATLPQVTRYLTRYNLVALPVVDENDHLLGAVTVDDVLDHLLPDDWREQDDSGEVADGS
jgi:flagellar motility protein MotE (MotC chaperone)